MGFQRQCRARFLAVDGGAKDVFVLAVHVAAAGVGGGQTPIDVAVALGVAVQDRQQVFAPGRIKAGNQRFVKGLVTSLSAFASSVTGQFTTTGAATCAIAVTAARKGEFGASTP